MDTYAAHNLELTLTTYLGTVKTYRWHYKIADFTSTIQITYDFPPLND